MKGLFSLTLSSVLHETTEQNTQWNYIALKNSFVGRDSSVSIATAYGLDGPGIESQWG
jgi:hypothetical protein